MLQSVNCIRMGQICLDSYNLQLLILCQTCHKNFRFREDEIKNFRTHLESCEGVSSLFQGHRIKYNTDKSTQVFGKTSNGLKEFLIYDSTDVEVELLKNDEHFIDLINIEEELLDPKWYNLSVEVNPTDAQKNSKQYDVLLDNLTPFVQFKENVKGNTSSSNGNSCQPPTPMHFKSNTHPNDNKVLTNKVEKRVKRKISAPKAANGTVVPQLQVESQTNTSQKHAQQNKPLQQSSHLAPKKCKVVNEIILNGPSKFSPLRPTTIPPKPQVVTMPTILSAVNASAVEGLRAPERPHMEPTKEKQTAQILNKLQNLGLQIKRTPAISSTTGCNTEADNKTLEILMKLQSKGMRVVKLVNKNGNRNVESIRNSTPRADEVAATQNFKKNIIIKKVN